MTSTEADALWGWIDDQRARTAVVLEGLTPQQWEHPSLCTGWTVRHVAAHLTMQRQRLRDAAEFIARHPHMLRHLTLNATIYHSAVMQAQELTTPELIQRIRDGIGSRRHNAFVTPLETLTDILVHSQDIAIPLGLEMTMEPAPTAVAATRRWESRGTWMASVNHELPLEGYRFSATDVEWTRGHGLEVAGPIGAILLLVTGRSASVDQLTGEGADALRSVMTEPA